MTQPVSEPGDQEARGSVLLIEADAEQARDMADELTLQGLEVIVSASHLKALSILEDRKDIDVVLVMAEPTDIGGFDFIHLLRHRNRFANRCIQAVVIAAAETFEQFPLDVSGVDDYLLRPYFPGELTWRVHKAIREVRSRRRLKSKSHFDLDSRIYKQFGLEKILHEEMNKIFRKKGVLSLIFFRFINLQVISVNHGHMMAQWMDRDLSMAIRNSLRSYDRLGRLDNGDYCLVAPDVDVKNLPLLVERLRKLVLTWNAEVASHSRIQIPICLALHSVALFPEYEHREMDTAAQALWKWICHECVKAVSVPGRFEQARLTSRGVETIAGSSQTGPAGQDNLPPSGPGSRDQMDRCA